MGELIWVPRMCPSCGGRLRKLRTRRTLHVSGKGAFEDVGLYFTDGEGKVVDLFSFYKCEQCGKLEAFSLEAERK